jgi:hypothetical protein
VFERAKNSLSRVRGIIRIFRVIPQHISRPALGVVPRGIEDVQLGTQASFI